jgi:hypothetical protein
MPEHWQRNARQARMDYPATPIVPFKNFRRTNQPTPLAFLLDDVSLSMKILVQNCLTHLYFKSPAEWTANPAEAKSFPTSENAILYCAEHQIPAVQIVLKFEPARYDITVPITEECEQAAGSQKALLN